MSVDSNTGCSAKRIEWLANDLAKVLLQPNKKPNGVSMNRKCEQRLTTDDRRAFTKVLGADESTS